VLVDLWSQQPNYKDHANYDTSAQETFMQSTLKRMHPFRDNGVDVVLCRNYTSECVKQFPVQYFDWIYIDARHDFKGVMQDLENWYPKLKRGGIMAGHDYVTQDDGPSQSGQDWTVNFDGTIDATKTVVKGAVDSFTRARGLQVQVSYREPGWNSFAFRKP
jgi:hypothetical protein